MRHRSRSVVFLSASCSFAVLLGIGSDAGAHDEDWRKLVNKLPPVFGPVWTPGVVPVGEDPSRGFAMQGVTVLSQIPINNFAGFHADANDCWGYVSPSGREYALIGLESGIGIVDVTEPTSPNILDTIPAPTTLWHDVKVIGEYAYSVSDQAGVGLQIMDLSDVDNGNVRFVGNSDAGGFTTAHNLVSIEETGRMFMVGGNVGNGGLVELDLTDPEAPQIAGGWTDFYVHDAQVVRYNEGPYAGREIAFCCSGLDSGFTNTGVRIVDVTDPDDFFTISTLFHSAQGYSHQAWLSSDRRYLYLNDELDETNNLVPQTTTRIVDVSDLSNPFQAGTFTSGSNTIDHNLYTRDEVIFESNYTNGLDIFDASLPLRPRHVGFIDTHPETDQTSFNGSWSNYPFFPSGNVVISDINRGLFVFTVDALAPRLVLRPQVELPEYLPVSGGAVLRLHVEEIGLSLAPGTVRLHVLGFSEQIIDGIPTGNPGEYEFSTPALFCPGFAGIWFSAEGDDGTVFKNPPNPPVGLLSVQIASELVSRLDDDFETDQGWTVSGNAKDGQWTRGVPIGGGDRADPATDFDGSGACFLTDNEDGNSDVDDGFTTLTSPRFDTTGGRVTLSYARWFSNTGGGQINEDVLLVEVSNDDGETWRMLETVGPTGFENGGGWIQESVIISSFLNPPSDVSRVRFTASDTGAGSLIEAGIDAVKLTHVICEEPPDCPADFAEPFGELNFSDVLAFLSAFGSADPAADLAEPFGELNFSDVLAFLGGFGAGCP